MDIALFRTDFFDRPEVQGLASDYLVLLACTVVHPRRQASGVVFFSEVAAKLAGIDHTAAKAGLAELDRLGLVFFDENTLEVIPADHFLVNPAGSKNANWNKAAIAAAARIVSSKVKSAREALEAAGGEAVPALAVPLNLISSLSPGGKLMLSDAAIALALYCNPFVSAAGTSLADIELLATMTAQKPSAAAAGIATAERRGIIVLDHETKEYRIRRWFDLPGKLVYEHNVSKAVEAANEIGSRKLRNAVLKDIASKLCTTPKVLQATFSIKSTTSCVPYLTSPNITSPHITKPHITKPTASPTASLQGEEEDGASPDFFSKQEKADIGCNIAVNAHFAKIANPGPYTDLAVDTVLLHAKNRAAAEQAFSHLFAADLPNIRNWPGFVLDAVKKANTGGLPAYPRQFWNELANELAAA